MTNEHNRNFNKQVQSFLEILKLNFPNDMYLRNVCDLFKTWVTTNPSSPMIMKHVQKIVGPHQNSIQTKNPAFLTKCNSLWFFKNFNIDLNTYFNQLTPQQQDAAWQYLVALTELAVAPPSTSSTSSQPPG